MGSRDKTDAGDSVLWLEPEGMNHKTESDGADSVRSL